MSENSDKQTELQKMLALKRHETPPPRFFSGFSTKVIDRLDSSDSIVPQTWWQKLGLDSRPVLVCISGVVITGCLAAGLIASLRVDPPKPSPRSRDAGKDLVVAPSHNELTQPAVQAAPASMSSEVPPIGTPVVAPSSSPIKIQPVKSTVNEPAEKASNGAR